MPLLGTALRHHPKPIFPLRQPSRDATSGLSGIPEYVTAHFTWHRFAAIQIWIFVLFLIYTSIVELNAALGGGRLGKIFFARRLPNSNLTAPVADTRARRAQL